MTEVLGRCIYCGDFFDERAYPGVYCGPECRNRATKGGELRGRCFWCNGPITNTSDCIVSTVSPKTLFCGRSCSDSAKRYEQQEGQRAGWISVEDRLPEDNKRVLAHCLQDGGAHYISIAWVQTKESDWKRWVLTGGAWLEIDDVSHWQPLPEPPVVEQKREVGQCRDCKNWGRKWYASDYGGQWGACKAKNENNLMVSTKELSGIYTSVDERLTRPDWGCIQFEPKGEE